MSGETIVLEELDGFGFEVACKRVFEALGWKDVRLGPRVSDAGRDIIMTSPEGERVIVECKHHLRQTIGRPVVQKLHSAVIYFSAVRGILVTTGFFSAEAREYAAGLKGLVELVDLHRFKELAWRAGFAVYERWGEAPEKALYTHTPREAADIVEGEMCTMVSRPSSPLELLSCSSRRLSYKPVYLVSYSVHSESYTSTGRLIDVVDDSGEAVVDGVTGEVLGSPWALFGEYCTAPLHALGEGRVTYPAVSPEGARERVAGWLIERYSRHVTYASSDGRRVYTKFVSPRRGDVEILFVSPLFVPELELTFSAREHAYRVVCDLSAPRPRFYKTNDMAFCTLCGERLPAAKRVLCNDCGAIAHTGLLRRHASYCGSCGKTICRNCAAARRRRWLVSMKWYCGECAQELGIG